MARADALVLDIGGRVGAVIVYTGPAWEGRELDLTPAGSPRSHQLHNVVRRRTTPAGESLFAAVFPEVQEGTYTLWGTAGPLGQVVVTGGKVSEIRPAAAA